jgi:hypothetical protein
MLCDSRIHKMQPLFKPGYGSGIRDVSDDRNTNERMADLMGSERASGLALLSLLDLLQGGATMELPFDILKKTDAMNFEWVEVVRDLQTAGTRIQELQARSPGEYVVFSQRTQQIVARFNSRTAGL